MKLNIIDSDSSKPYHCNLTHEYLDRYAAGTTFIETGTYLGDGVKMALAYGKFTRIHSIELHEGLYNEAVEKFKNEEYVFLRQGDSVDIIQDYVKRGFLIEPATFWLDAHASGQFPGGKYGGSPLLHELDAIKSSGQSGHTIFIDDRRLFGGNEFGGLKEEDIIAKLREINPFYGIEYLDGHTKEDIVCAFVLPSDH